MQGRPPSEADRLEKALEAGRGYLALRCLLAATALTTPVVYEFHVRSPGLWRKGACYLRRPRRDFR